MTSIWAVVAVLGASSAFEVVVSAWLLQASLRIAPANKTKFQTAMATTLAVWLLSLVVFAQAAGLMSVAPRNRAIQFLIGAGALGLIGGLSLWMLISRHRTSQQQAAFAWLAIQFATWPNLLLAQFVVKPYLVEAFTVPVNSMAPTICGEHLQEPCPVCGGTLIVSSSSVKLDRDLGICTDCLRTTEVPILDRKLYGGDRVLVCKVLKPRRWDLIVFRYPDDPSVPYVKRLVGLPGETLSIHDGGVWVQDKELQKPANLSGLTYVANPFRPQENIWGPVTLAADESFVLGDFSARSKDSRLWEVGAPGHPPYAVPDTHLIGVVTHIYWPPSRWRVFR